MAEIIVVFGATGVVGLGIVKYFLSTRDITVIAPVNYLDEPEKVSEYIKANIPSGQVDHGVLTAGGFNDIVTATSITQSQLHEAINQKVLTGIKGTAALLPLVKNQSSSTFTVVTGGAGEIAFTPAMGLLTIANAAQFGFVQALISECASNSYRVNELRIAAFIRRDNEAENRYFPGAHSAPSSAVAAAYVRKVVDDTAVRGAVVRVKTDDLI